MIFTDIPSGSTIFLDANTFVYHFVGDPTLSHSCAELLRRVETGDINAYTSAHILTETAHRLMTLEAVSVFGWSYTGIARKLRRHFNDIGSLTLFRSAIKSIRASRCAMLPITDELVEDATTISQSNGLLSGDALIVAVLRKHGLTQLASHDSDFDRIPGITRFAPV